VARIPRAIPIPNGRRALCVYRHKVHVSSC
jgi:hypothetical protein